MQKNVEGFYLIGVFTIYNMMLLDSNIAGFEIKSLVLLLFTLLVIFIKVICGERIVGAWKEWDKADWIACVVAGISFAGIVYKMFTNPRGYEQYAVVLSIAAIYILMRRTTELGTMVYRFYSISNIVIALVLLISWLACESLAELAPLLTGEAIPGWVLLAMLIGALGYCVDDKWRAFYGIGLVLQALVMFLNKNLVVITIFAIAVLTLPLVFKPTKKIIRNAMQIFFGYMFLLANMSLLAGYTPLLKGLVSYDLEISVYIELCLALFGVGFFHYWDKEKADEKEEEILLISIREFIKKVLCMTAIIIGAGYMMLVTGKGLDEYSKIKILLEQIRASMLGQKGLISIAIEIAGGIGFCVIVLILTLILYKLVISKSRSITAEQRGMRWITVVFLVQGIMLTQTMVTIPMYVVFVCVYMNQIRDKR